MKNNNIFDKENLAGTKKNQSPIFSNNKKLLEKVRNKSILLDRATALEQRGTNSRLISNSYSQFNDYGLHKKIFMPKKEPAKIKQYIQSVDGLDVILFPHLLNDGGKLLNKLLWYTVNNKMRTILDEVKHKRLNQAERLRKESKDFVIDFREIYFYSLNKIFHTKNLVNKSYMIADLSKKLKEYRRNKKVKIRETIIRMGYYENYKKIEYNSDILLKMLDSIEKENYTISSHHYFTFIIKIGHEGILEKVRENRKDISPDLIRLKRKFEKIKKDVEHIFDAFLAYNRSVGMVTPIPPDVYIEVTDNLNRMIGTCNAIIRNLKSIEKTLLNLIDDNEKYMKQIIKILSSPNDTFMYLDEVLD